MSESRRPNASYDNLEDIINALDGPHVDGVWVGKNYSKRNLIDDLKRLQSEYEAPPEKEE